MLLLTSFLKNSAAALVPFAKVAAKKITVIGTLTDHHVRWAWQNVRRESGLFRPEYFRRLNTSLDRDEAFLLVVLIGMVDLENPPKPIMDVDETSPLRWVAEQIVSATAEEMTAWLKTPEAVELMVVAEDRFQTWCKIYDFMTVEHRIVLGEYKGIPVFNAECVDRIFEKSRMSEDDSDSPSPQRAMELARLYIDAAFSLVPDFKAAGFNAGYGENNLPYLRNEYEESGQLFRVFVPFVPINAEESPQIEGAKKIALMRAILDPPEEPDYQITPEVQRLLDIVPAFEE